MSCCSRVSKNTESRRVSFVLGPLKLKAKGRLSADNDKQDFHSGLDQEACFICKELVCEKLLPKYDSTMAVKQAECNDIMANLSLKPNA